MAGLEGVKGVWRIGLDGWVGGGEGLEGGHGRRFHDIISWFQGEQYDGLVRIAKRVEGGWWKVGRAGGCTEG